MANVVCIVDDLFFSIKIKTAARHLGTDVYFERSGDQALDTIRAQQPRLVIFDLDAARLRATEIVAAMRADPDLGSIDTLGFVSHVHADTIAAARAAGVGQVLARSAFTTKLESILGPRT